MYRSHVHTLLYRRTPSDGAHNLAAAAIYPSVLAAWLLSGLARCWGGG